MNFSPVRGAGNVLKIGRRSELPDRALDPVAPAIRLRRVNRIVVSGLRLEAVHTHAENCFRMVLVKSDGDRAIWLRSLGFVP